MRTPLRKIIRRLEEYYKSEKNESANTTTSGTSMGGRLEKIIVTAKLTDAKPQFAVVLITGSMNPVHKSHIRMLELAAETLQKNNWVVLGGFVSLSHDSHVK
jgi:hypothetical protein